METHARSIAKAVSYRFFGSLTTAAVVYVVSGSWTASLGAGAADSVLKLGLYFLHERMWNHITFGREKPPPEYEI